MSRTTNCNDKIGAFKQKLEIWKTCTLIVNLTASQNLDFSGKISGMAKDVNEKKRGRIQ